ncbi:sensor histidine kinase [Microlunatus flavus]|uniref:histidine kinase n=1 Tax=Microlunatus flavus TaxID=1036181 RepID=A0A1H9LST0_9ACTN|nr:HAMP domain-containing sensor histidine kinase [Microlunatus flavus]SER14521.1 Signal transduction histidine kinase [Microlunatus flavus]
MTRASPPRREPGQAAADDGGRDAVRIWGPARWGLRRRSVVTAVVVVGVALLAGSAVLLVLLQAALVTTERTEVSNRASDITALVRSDGLAAAELAVQRGGRRGEVTQVVGAAGDVLATSDPRLAGTPLSSLRPTTDSTVITTLPELPLLDDPDDHLVAVRRVVADRGPVWVLVASPVQVQADTVRTVALFLLLALPLLLVLVGLAVRFLVGRSLQSVERIRRQVEAVDAAHLSARVPVPPTGDEVALLAQTMNAMLGRLEDSDEALRAFLSDAGHELRSPLATLVAALDLTAADPGAAARLELAPVVRAEVQRLQGLVEDLLTLAKADAHTLLPVLRDVDLDDVLEGEVRRLRALGGPVVRAELPPAQVSGDAGRLGQVFRNLLDNAVRHAVAEVAVTLRPGESEVRVDVDNDGPPVRAEDRERVFERFVRLEPGRAREAGGTGLGLAISAAVVRLHGGTISTGATPEGWCRFSVVLPVVEVDAP